jgi:hypothetical protein
MSRLDKTSYRQGSGNNLHHPTLACKTIVTNCGRGHSHGGNRGRSCRRRRFRSRGCGCGCRCGFGRGQDSGCGTVCMGSVATEKNIEFLFAFPIFSTCLITVDVFLRAVRWFGCDFEALVTFVPRQMTACSFCFRYIYFQLCTTLGAHRHLKIRPSPARSCLGGGLEGGDEAPLALVPCHFSFCKGG